MKADLYRFEGGKPCHLDDMPTDGKKEELDKEKILAKTQRNLAEMSALQDAFYADGREGLILILQAMDAAGKDSTVKHVMGGLNPQGVTVHSFKQPTAEELSHDYLWRVNRALPRRGEIAIFNRSYYEDVLIVRVHELQKNYRMADRVLQEDPDQFFEKRYRQIRNYEEYLYENSYRVVKLFLHVSKAEQKQRFLERLDKPEKNWKFSAADLKERALFGDYRKAYETAITETSTRHSPWYALPADQKWYTRYLASEIVADALKHCDPHYPELSTEAAAQLADYRAQLGAEK